MANYRYFAKKLKIDFLGTGPDAMTEMGYHGDPLRGIIGDPETPLWLKLRNFAQKLKIEHLDTDLSAMTEVGYHEPPQRAYSGSRDSHVAQIEVFRPKPENRTPLYRPCCHDRDGVP